MGDAWVLRGRSTVLQSPASQQRQRDLVCPDTASHEILTHSISLVLRAPERSKNETEPKARGLLAGGNPETKKRRVRYDETRTPTMTHDHSQKRSRDPLLLFVLTYYT